MDRRSLVVAAATSSARCRSATGSSASLRGEDIRTHGSGNIGATNVWRVYGRGYGIPVALLDVAKGFVPALVGLLVGGETLGVLAGAAAMLGHWRPLFLGFQKGGKTVATAGGVTFALAPLVAALLPAIWVVDLPRHPLLVGRLARHRGRAAGRGSAARGAVADRHPSQPLRAPA